MKCATLYILHVVGRHDVTVHDGRPTRRACFMLIVSSPPSSLCTEGKHTSEKRCTACYGWLDRFCKLDGRWSKMIGPPLQKEFITR